MNCGENIVQTLFDSMHDQLAKIQIIPLLKVCLFPTERKMRYLYVFRFVNFLWQPKLLTMNANEMEAYHSLFEIESNER